MPFFTLRTALRATPFVSDLYGVDVQLFQERFSQALPNSKELPTQKTLSSSCFEFNQVSTLLVHRSQSGLAHSFLEALLAQPSQPPRNPWVTTRKRHPGNHPFGQRGRGKGHQVLRCRSPHNAEEFRSHPQKPTRELSGCKQLSQQWATNAKQAVTPGPVGERLDRCAKFVGRAEKRLQKADEALLKLQEDRATLARELAEGRARLEALRAEASKEIIGPAPPTGEHSGTEEVRKLRELVETLRSSFESAKKDRWRDSEELCGERSKS